MFASFPLFCRKDFYVVIVSAQPTRPIIRSEQQSQFLTAASYSEARSSKARNSAPKRWCGVLENLAKVHSPVRRCGALENLANIYD